MTNIVGVSRVHNSAVTLLKNGKIEFHIENERFSNIKFDGFPFQSLSQIPQYVKNIEYIGIAGVGKTVPTESFSEQDVYSTFIKHLDKSFFNDQQQTVDFWQEHHLMHAACAFYNSGFSEALCIIEDGMGSEFYINDDRFLSGSYGREKSSVFMASYPCNFELIEKEILVPFKCNANLTDKIQVLDSVSPALAFQKTALHFGFHELDAGKVMGMASYGVEDINIPPIVVDGVINKQLFTVHNSDLRKVYLNTKNYPYLDTTDFQIQANFARVLQLETQQYVKEKILRLINTTNQKNLCLSGGFFLNCVANYEYLKDLPKDVNIYIEPISSDAGTALGAAKYIWHNTTKDCTIRKQDSIYYGPTKSYTHTDIEKLANNNTIITVDYDKVAKLISEKNIIAIYQGQSEAGPRALGNRSILYDPRDPNGKDYVNRVKQREWFRPFAGSILLEDVHNWFDLRGLESSPFMMYAVNALLEKINLIPGIVHIDGTCRIQTVDEIQNLHFYQLIQAFKEITGIPILFNTSFNLAGDCIVETLEQAIDTLNRSDINFLYLPEFKLLIGK